VNALLGHSGILLAFVAAVAGTGSTAYGLVRKRPSLAANSRHYVWLLLLGAVLATIAMQHALITHDFSITFVVQNSSRHTPLLFLITGMWSALQGSILLWGLILSVYIAAAAHRFRKRADDPLFGWAMVTCFVVAAFFFGLMLVPVDPFAHVIGAIPLDGPGPNPLLQNNPLVVIHPPLLYIGYVGFTVPFAFAIGALVTGRLGEAWLVATRRWTVIAWGSLTVGVVLGMWWSYQVLGWGGYWAWDPVENASLLPWLTATAYLHSVVVQERRGLLRVWNLSLLLATFSLTILGTFLTRSGVIQSVHAFSDGTLGPLLLGFFGVVVVVGVGLIGWRADRLRTPGGLDSPVSRESAFLANNMLFSLFTFIVLLGTVFPLFVEAVKGNQITVGKPYFDRVGLPIGLGLLFLMAVGPALPWRRASREVVRSRLTAPTAAAVGTLVVLVAAGVRGVEPLIGFAMAAFAGASAVRHLVLTGRRKGLRALLGRVGGGMVVHIGLVILAVGWVASSAYGQRTELTLNVGQSTTYAGHTFKYLGTRFVRYPSRFAQEGLVQVDGGAVTARPAISKYTASSDAVGTPWVMSNPLRDIYLTFDQPPPVGHPGGVAVIGVVEQPLILWLWVGGAIMGIGSALALVPTRRQKGERREALRRFDAGSDPGSASGDEGGDGVDPVDPSRPDLTPSRRAPVGVG
jgi:cytochrome c-type biogenesis protein CcmF